MLVYDLTEESVQNKPVESQISEVLIFDYL